MTEVLLKELSNSDIDWMLATGSREEMTTGAVLIRQGQPVNALYISSKDNSFPCLGIILISEPY